MKDTDKSGNKVFGLIHLVKHTEDDIPDGMKETVKERAVTKKVNTEFFRDSKNTVSVGTGNQLTGHGKRPLLIVFIATGRTEAAFATKRRKLEIAAVRATKHGSTMGRVTTVNHLFNVFYFSFTWMESVNDFLIMVSKNGL